MSTQIVFETHSISEDNERGLASGWLPGRLSVRGRGLAAELGQRRSGSVDAIFASDLGRAAETADVAFSGSGVPVLLDWRLRECDYGDLNGAPAGQVHGDRVAYLDTPYPGGESWRQAVDCVGRFLLDLPRRWDDRRVLVIGHVATRWGLECQLAGRTVESLVQEDFAWQAGWVYRLP